MTQKKKLIKLGIAMDYAVNWEFERILRDLIQNFYDSIGWKNFYKEFYLYTVCSLFGKHTLKMKTFGHPFSYEWLTYVGGSTKTASPGKQVGMYGEGFKICALCLKRAGKSLRMESADWILTACTYTESIGGTKVKMLGYYLRERQDDGQTTLTINGLSDCEINCLEEAFLHFYYPENPLMGRILCRKKNYAVYLRSNIAVPCEYGEHIPGVLYCNYLARGRLPFELVFFLSTDLRDDDNRSRKTFRDFESIMLLNHFAYQLDPKGSYQILTHLKKYWNDLPCRQIDVETLYYFICQLVRNVASSRTWKNKFMRKYRNLVYIDRPVSDRIQTRRVEAAADWARSNPDYSRSSFVNPIFRKLGARSVLKDYEKNVENLRCKQMSAAQNRLYRILFQAFETVYPYKVYEERPEMVIVSSCHMDPMQYCERDYRKNNSGRRYKIHKVAMDSHFFSKDSFRDAFLELSRILLHVYGRDHSAAINIALTDLGAGLIHHALELTGIEEIWKNTENWEKNTDHA